MYSAISIKDLTKVYKNSRGKKKTAVESLSFEVLEGEIFGFLGPNGAGKTTTIKTLLGFIRPTSGDARIMGLPVDDCEARSRVGYLPEQPYFHKFMTPLEIISMHAALIGIPRKERKSCVAEAIETVGLQEISGQRIGKMSKGQVQRVGIAQALVGDPKILILDEPSSGLDPLGRRQIRDLLVQQREQGRTVFLSSHLLSEIETVCDRVAVLSQGMLKAIGSPEEIKQSRSQFTVTTSILTPELSAIVNSLVANIRSEADITSITIDSEQVYDLIEILHNANLPLFSVSPEKESLEDAFLRLAA